MSPYNIIYYVVIRINSTLVICDIIYYMNKTKKKKTIITKIINV